MEKQHKVFLLIGIVICIGLILNLLFNRQKDSTIKVGVITPLTGFSQEHGQNIANGIKLAYDQLNNSNIELIFEDSKCDAKEGVNAYNSLKVKGVDAIIGTVCSSVTLAIAPLAENDKIVLISATASSLEISKSGEYIFRVYPSDELDASIISDFIKESKIAVASINNDYGTGVLIKLQEKIGNQIVINSKFEFGESDFRSILTKIKSLNPEKIILVGYPENTLDFLKQARELGITQPIIGSSATFTADLFNKNYKDFYFTSPGVSPEGKNSFIESYKNKYNSDPGYPSEYGYDNFLILSEALRNNSNSQLIEKLQKTSVDGATGNVSFDNNGDRVGLKINVYAIEDIKVQCIFNCD